MKRFYYTLGIGTVLVWGLMWLMTWAPTVQAQTDPNAPTAPNAVYLPLISLSVPVPTPTPISHIKKYSGIHMGNRGKDTDWPLAAFALITGTAEGIWPAATVIQSAQPL